MGIYDRDYNRHSYSRPTGGMRMAMPPLTPVVKWLLIINISVFVVSMLAPPLGNLIYSLFAVSTESVFLSLQIWRIITYQFLHAGLGHIFMNMLVLYFFGPTLEMRWGSKKFITFYLTCGAIGGILYPVMYYIGLPFMTQGTLVGASGAIYGLIAACVIYYPRAMVYIYGIFPIPLAVLGVVMVIFSMSGMLAGQNAGGEVAHLSGMAAGAVYVLWQPWFDRTRQKMNEGKWRKKVEDERNLHKEVDRILEKVHNSGMKSLTRKEKQILRKATENEQGR